MGKIVKLKTETDNVLDFLDSMKEEIVKNNVNTAIIACKCEDGSVLISNTKGLTWVDKQELNSHIQINIINDMIKENYVVP